MLSRPAFHALLPSGPPRKHGGLAGTHAFAGWGRFIVSEPARESMAHPDARTAEHSGNGPNGPCRTAPDDADEGKADRPP
jgi:hypothetical protein